MHSAAGSSDVAEFMCRVCKVVARVLRKWGEELRFVVLSEVGSLGQGGGREGEALWQWLESGRSSSVGLGPGASARLGGYLKQ